MSGGLVLSASVWSQCVPGEVTCSMWSASSPPMFMHALHVAYVFLLCVAQTEEELSVNQNDEVNILSVLGDGWIKVRCGDREGFVPESYVSYEM